MRSMRSTSMISLQRLLLKAARKGAAFSTVSALALMFVNLGSGPFDHDGIKPHRMDTNSPPEGVLRITMASCVGAML